MIGSRLPVDPKQFPLAPTVTGDRISARLPDCILHRHLGEEEEPKVDDSEEHREKHDRGQREFQHALSRFARPAAAKNLRSDFNIGLLLPSRIWADS